MDRRGVYRHGGGDWRSGFEGGGDGDRRLSAEGRIHPSDDGRFRGGRAGRQVGFHARARAASGARSTLFGMGRGWDRSASSCGMWCACAGVYTAAMVNGRADFSKKHSHYMGPLTREGDCSRGWRRSSGICWRRWRASTLRRRSTSSAARSALATSPTPWSSTRRSIMGSGVSMRRWRGSETPVSWRREWGL